MRVVVSRFSLDTRLPNGRRRIAAAAALHFCWFLVAMTGSGGAAAISAQTGLPQPVSRFDHSRSAPLPAGTVATTMSSPAAFPVEALGGTAGAALGYGALFLIGNDGCGDDLTCALSRAGAALLAGTFGAGGGAYAAGRLFDTQPSGWGAVAGAIAGAAAVLGLDHAIGGSSWMNDGARVAIYSVTHGGIAALGSRLGAALR